MTEREIFFEAIEIASADEREAYLRGACGKDVSLRRKVDELLTEHFANDSLLEGPAVEGRPTEVDTMPISEGTGSLIDRYKLLQKIGEGGFGVVYMAEQKEPVKRRVALKIIKLGMDTKQVVARFEAERQALAMMDHPNIAKVLDAGSTDTGRPYFVMELVKGIPVTKYCDENNLTTDERLQLFMDVCAAIQHAHQKGIIHRDIKPSNILITLHDGVPVPKVIDFGIAKATQQELTEKTLFTQFSQFIGTPAYMSPEQAEMSGLDIDTRSDIYSLGVLFYELLTSRTPLDSKELMSGGYDEIRRRIREEEPSKPSTRVSTMVGEELTDVAKHRRTESSRLSHQLRGDLDWIAMKALEKDRTRRYETANALKLDIERFLEDEPVTAVAPSVGYKFQKFVRRNRVVFAATTGIAAALIIGITTATWQAVRANQNARIANQKTEEAVKAGQLEQEQRELAEESARQAELARKAERTLRYAADMAVVRNAVQDRNATLGIQTLEKHRPGPGEPDLRGWEWDYLYGKFFQQKDQLRVGRGAHEIAVAPDGNLVAIAGNVPNHEVVQILSYPDLKFLQTHPRPWGWIAGMRFSPDGKSLLFEKGGVHRFDLESGNTVQLLDQSKSAESWPLKLSMDQRWLVGAYGAQPNGRELRCFSATTGEQVSTSKKFYIHNSGMRDHILQISPDGTAVAEGCVGNNLRIFSLPDLKEVIAIKSPGNVSVVAWAPDGKTVATSYDYPYRYDLWDVRSGDHRGSLPNDSMGPGLELCFSPDGALIAGSDWGNIVSVWRTDDLELIHTYAGAPMGRIWGLTFHPDNRTLLGVSGEGSVLVWDTAAPAESDLVRLSREEKLWDFQFAPNGQTLAAMDPSGDVVLFDAQTEELVNRFPTQQRENKGKPLHTWAPRISFSPDGRSLVAANMDHTATVYDVPTRNVRLVLEANGKPFVNLRFSPDGRMIGGVRQDRTLALWDSASGELIRVLEKVDFFDFHPDMETRWIAARTGRNISLVHMETGERRTASATVPESYSVTISPDGKTLAVGREAEVRLFNIPNLELVTTITGSRGPVPIVAFHPEGDSLAIPAWDGTVQIWNRRVNGVVTQMPVPKDWVVNAQFSPDGNTLAVSTKEGGIQLYRSPSPDRYERWEREEQESLAYLEEVDRRLSNRFAKDPSSVNRWLLLGPIPNPSDTPEELAVALPKEALLQPVEGTIRKIGDQQYSWTARTQNTPMLDLHAVWSDKNTTSSGSFDNHVAYAVAYVWSDRPRDGVVLKMGSDDDALLYLNGKEIHRFEGGRKLRLDQDTVHGLSLRQGINRIVLKVANRTGPWGASVRLLEKDGSELDGLRVTLDPDE